MGNAESTQKREIGSRNSGACNFLTTSGRECPVQVASRHLGPGFKASGEKRVGANEEPRITLDNRSSYRVSYWVAKDDKTRATAQHILIVRAMGLEATLGNGGETASSNGSRETEGTCDMEEDANILLRNHRIQAGAETQTKEVVFPKDCQDLRVYGFFEEEGKWILFKDKVYSIGWFRKVFTLSALDTCISPYTKTRNSNYNNDTVRAVHHCP